MWGAEFPWSFMMNNEKPNFFKVFRKIRNIVLMVMLTLLPFFAALVIFTSIPDCGKTKTSVPKPDMDNFRIEDLTEQQIVEIEGIGGAYMSGISYREGRSGIKGKYSDKDYTYGHYHAKNCPGIKTLQATRVENDTVIIDVKTKVEKGTAKFVIIKDGVIVETFESNTTERFTYHVKGESIILVKGLFEKDVEGVDVEVARAFGGELPSFTR